MKNGKLKMENGRPPGLPTEDLSKVGALVKAGKAKRHLPFLVKFPGELLFWVAALLFIFFTTGPIHEAHFSLCPLSNVGIDFCPGCGLGHSIGHILRAEIIESFSAHPLGVFALGVMLFRIYTLIKNQIKNYGFRNN